MMLQPSRETLKSISLMSFVVMTYFALTPHVEAATFSYGSGLPTTIKMNQTTFASQAGGEGNNILMDVTFNWPRNFAYDVTNAVVTATLAGYTTQASGAGSIGMTTWFQNLNCLPPGTYNIAFDTKYQDSSSMVNWISGGSGIMPITITGASQCGSIASPPSPPSPPGASGVCSNTPQNCFAGVFSDLADTAYYYNWQCLGTAGGANRACSAPKAVGDVTIRTNIAASWSISGQITGGGSGTLQTLSQQPMGSYTVTFNPVAGFTTPSPQTMNNMPGEGITFFGTYVLPSNSHAVIDIPESGHITIPSTKTLMFTGHVNGTPAASGRIFWTVDTGCTATEFTFPTGFVQSGFAFGRILPGNLTLGTHTLYFRIKDTNGAYSSCDTRQITIIDPPIDSPPTATILTPSGDLSVATGGTTLFTGIGEGASPADPNSHLSLHGYLTNASPTSIVYDSITNSVWVLNPGNTSVTKINVNTGSMAGTYGVGSSASAPVDISIAFDPISGSIWVPNWDSNTVTKINVNTGGRSGDYAVGIHPTSVAFDPITQSVWVTNYGANTVSQLSVTTGTRMHADYATSYNPSNIAFDSVNNQMWVVDSGSTNLLSRFTVSTGARSDYVLNPAGGQQNIFFIPQTNSVWVTHSGNSLVTRINVTSGLQTEYPGLAPLAFYASSVVGNISFDPISQSLWIIFDMFSSSVSMVSQINLATGERNDLEGDSSGNDVLWPGSMAFDTHTNSMWLTYTRGAGGVGKYSFSKIGLNSYHEWREGGV